MRFSEITTKIELHDSIINKFVYCKDNRNILIDLELCVDDPTMSPEIGQLILDDVDNFSATSTALFREATAHNDIQINDVTVQQLPNELENCKIVVISTDYRLKNDEVIVVEFTCTSAVWEKQRTELNSAENI